MHNCAGVSAHGYVRAAMAKSPDSTAVVTTNISNGLSWFRSTPENVKKMGTSVDVQPRPQNIPLPVLFINKGQATIMGTTKGYVAIFEAKRGKRIQALKHGEGTFSQDASTVFSDIPLFRRNMGNRSGEYFHSLL